jgi:hypothetical protein
MERLRRIYKEDDARKFNADSGEIWVFEHRGMSVWYKGINPDRPWTIEGAGTMGRTNSFLYDEDAIPKEILWSSDFTMSQKMKDVGFIKQEGIKFNEHLTLKEIVLYGEREWDEYYPYLDDDDIGAKGYVETSEGRFEAELVDVFTVEEGWDDEGEFEWIDEITGVICILPHWDRRIKEE